MQNATHRPKIPSLVKKYLMAITGLILVMFVLGHLLGNLQVFLPPDYINAYAYQLHSMPAFVLWGIRLFLLAMVGIHIWMAVLLTIENRRARPDRYIADRTVEASFSSRTMRWSGFILLAFIIFHLLHFTAQDIFPEYKNLKYVLGGKVVHDVYGMMVMGFTVTWVSLFYLIAMALLCMHLSHGVSSMFQSVGLRNERWRYRLDKVAVAYGWIIFLGFASMPAAALVSKYTNLQLLPVKTIEMQTKSWDGDNSIYINYNP